MAYFHLAENGYDISLKYVRPTKLNPLLDYDKNPFIEFKDSFKDIFKDKLIQEEVEKEYAKCLNEENFKERNGALLVIFAEGKEFREETAVGICGWQNLVDIDETMKYYVSLQWFGICTEFRKIGIGRIAHRCLEFTLFNYIDRLICVCNEDTEGFWKKVSAYQNFEDKKLEEIIRSQISVTGEKMLFVD